MAIFELQGPDGIYEVDAPDAARAVAAFKKMNAPAGPRQGPEQPEGEKMSTGKSLQEGLLSGLTLNFRDELKGLSEASGVPGAATSALGPLGLAVRPGIGAARLGYEYLTGKGGEGSATETYERERDAQRSISKAAEEYAPATNLLGNVVGSVVLPGGGALKGASLGARAARAGLAGGVAGGISGLGEGTDLESRATEGGKGAVLGAAVGGVAAPLVAGASRIPGMVGRLVRGGDAEDEALRQIGSAYQRDVARDPTAIRRMTDREFAQAPDAAAIDLGGEEVRRLARGARNRSPEADFALTQTIDPRFENQSPRVMNWLESNISFRTPQAEEAARASIAKARTPAYEKAYGEGTGMIKLSDELMSSDAVSNAIKSALPKVRDEEVIKGYGAMNPRVTVTDDGRVVFNSPAGYPVYPDLQFWDLVRRELSGHAAAAPRGSTDERRYGLFAKRMNEELDRAIPSYAAARKTGAEFFEARDAAEAGKNFVRAKAGKIDEGLDVLGKMSSTEQKLFKDNYVREFVASLGDVADRRDVLNKIAANPNAKKQLLGVLGKRKADELEATLRIEGLMNLPRKVLTGQSSTAQQLLEQSAVAGLGGAAGAVLSGGDYKSAGIGMLAGVMRRRQHQFGNKVADEIGRKLASNDPAIYQQGIRLLTARPQGLQMLRDLDQQIAKTAGAQSE